MDVVEVVKDAGALGLALFLVWSFLNDKLHGERSMQRERDNTKRERERGDRFEEMLITALQVGARSVKLAEHKIYEFDQDKEKLAEERSE